MELMINKLKFFIEYQIEVTKMLSDDKAQLSVEYLLLVMVTIVIFTVIILPLLGIAIDFTFDSLDSLTIKSEISKITKSIDIVYSNGAGAKRSVVLDLPKEVEIDFSKSVFGENGVSNKEEGIAIFNILLSDGNWKTFEISYKYPNLEQSLHLYKGKNVVVVEWSTDSDEIIIYHSN
jgi:hypothetical protein